ncbi:MAG: chemotaxis protein CheW [Pirellulaceae bacterium]|nr:chemotaxis protein CheW [Pirellulaceae bacterium]
MTATQVDKEHTDTVSCDPVSDNKYCVFRSGENWFAIPAVAVREITTSPELVCIPGCHRSLAGVCHLRAEFIPVISIDGILGIGPTREVEDENTLLVIDGNATWALRIAEAGSIESLEVLSNAEPHQDEPPESVELGTATHRDQIVRVLDHNGVYRNAKRLVASHWGTPASRSRPTQCTESTPNPE